MKLKLISDGTSIGTKIVNEETGEEVEDVVRMRWELDAGCASLLSLDIEVASAEITWSEPIVREQVIGAHWGDYDPKDAWAIGILTSTINDSQGRGYKIDRRARVWRHCKVISDEQAKRFREEAEL